MGMQEEKCRYMGDNAGYRAILPECRMRSGNRGESVHYIYPDIPVKDAQFLSKVLHVCPG